MNPIKFYRLPDWIKNLGIVLVALTINATQAQHLAVLPFAAFLFAYAFSINDYYDAKLSGETNYLHDKLGGETLLLCVAPAIVATIMSFLFGITVVLTSLIFLFSMWAYSCPPVRAKRIPFIDLLLNVICFGVIPYTVVLTCLGISFDTRNTILLVLFSLYVAYSEVIHQLSDLPEDIKAGIGSIPQLIGKRASYLLSMLFVVMPLALSVPYLYIDLASYSFLIITVGFSAIRLMVLLRHADYRWLRDNSFGSFEGLSYIAYFLLLRLI